MNRKHINAERVSGDVYNVRLNDTGDCCQTNWAGIRRIAHIWDYHEIRLDLSRYHAADEPITEVVRV